jgi:hypothetical protein
MLYGAPETCGEFEGIKILGNFSPINNGLTKKVKPLFVDTVVHLV